MTTLQQQIAEKFLAAIAKDKNFDAPKVEALRRLLGEAKKPKADDFVGIFSTPAGDDVA
jgi:HEPN domain-containing protein